MKYSYDPSGNVAVRAVSALLPPQITGQPVKQVAEPGSVVTFSVVVADPRAVTFQWKFNAANIPGATGDSLLLTNVSAANEGPYSVVVTNSAGSVTSESATLVFRNIPIVDSETPPRLIIFSDDGGSVTVTPIMPYNAGDTVTVSVVPSADHVFVGWIGDLNSNLITDTLILDGNKTVRARFASIRPQLVVYSGAGGSVAVTPMQLSYELDQLVTVTATPFPPSVFLSWTGDLKSTANPHRLTMDKSMTIRARFATAVPLLPGLIALWRGETDASDLARDLIGGHDGTFFAGAAVVAQSVTALGKVAGAFSFDGTVHVRVPDSAALQPAQFTAEAWVFPTATPSTGPQTIIARGNSLNTWDLRLVNNRPQFWSHGAQGLEGPSAIPLNEWTHLAISFDGRTKRLYVNGAEVASRGEPHALVYPASLPITIGSDWTTNASSNLYNGRIDEVAIYNRALTAEEVLSIYNADFLGKNFSQPYFTSSAQLPDGVRGTSYTQQIATILGTSPVSISLPEGVLPPGIMLLTTGLVSGVPGASGTFRFTARATDARGAFTEQRCILPVV